MSEVRSDNRLERHPKPVQEYERRYVGGNVWVDWADFAEMEAVYDAVYRDNKYFWVAGVYYECYENGTAYRAISGAAGAAGVYAVSVPVLTTGMTLTVSELAGHTFILAIQGATPYTSVYIEQTGTVLDFTNVGGVFDGETILIFYI